MKNPEISVIMGIYNCADTLSEAIESVLGQTMSEWELIMCDDGSSDATSEVAEFYIKKYPERMVLLKNKENRGLNYTLNRCLKMATGKYIARMDGDDICLPERFAVEYEILEKEKVISIVSTDMGYFDETGIWGNISHPEYPKKEDFLHGSPFCHAPCMVRKEAYDAVKGYTEKKRLLRVEDYHLWIKMYEVGYRGKNIPKQLYLMRDDKAAYKRRKFRYRVNEAYVRGMAVRKLGLPISGYLYAIQPIIIGILPKESGWSHYAYSVEFAYADKKRYLCKNGDDPFMQLFVKDYILRESCSSCHFKGYHRVSDITLGDFWGIWNINPKMDDNKGTSLILTHTAKGEKMMNAVSENIKCEQVYLEQAARENPSLLRSSVHKQNRDIVLKTIESENFQEILPLLQVKQPQRRSKKEIIKRVLKKLCGLG